jgi:hypothetical protein
MKYTGWCQNDFNVQGYARRGRGRRLDRRSLGQVWRHRLPHAHGGGAISSRASSRRARSATVGEPFLRGRAFRAERQARRRSGGGCAGA